MPLIREREDLEKLCLQLSKIIRNEKVLGMTGKAYQPQGTSTINNLAVIANILSDIKAAHTLEIGMAYGASTLVFCSILHGSEKSNVNHVVIDPFQEKHYDNCGLQVVKEAGLSHLVELHYQSSCIVLPQLLEEGRELDLIYIDGSHLFEDVFIDAYYSIRLLREGGIVLFDDSSTPHVAKVIHFLRTNLLGSLETLSLEPWRIEGSTSLKYQMAKKMNKVQLTGFRRVGSVERPQGIALTKF